MSVTHREDHADRHGAGGPDELAGKLNANARVAVRKNSGGTPIIRRRVNTVEGHAILLTLADDAVNEEADLTIAVDDTAIVHNSLSGLTTGDPHTQYLLESLVDAKGDLIGATADNTPARVGPVGANDTVLTADSAQSAGVKWALPGMQLIATQTLGSAASSVTFSSIPGTYRHLRLVGACRCNDAVTQSLRLRFNNVTTANYDWEADGGWYGANQQGANAETSMFLTFVPGNDYGSPYAAYIDFILPFYSGSTFMKTATGHGVLTDRQIYSVMGALTTLSAAITQLGIFASAGNLVTGSTFSLYGLA